MSQEQTIFYYKQAAIIGVEEYVLALFLKENFGINSEYEKPLSVAKMSSEIIFFSPKQLKRLLKSLEDGGWITAEKINAKSYDQSKAYKFTEKFYQLTTPF